MTILDLPDEMLKEINEYLDDDCYKKFYFVNKFYYNYFYDKIFAVINDKIKIDTYIRSVLRIDSVFLFTKYLSKINTKSLMKKKISYKNNKMKYDEYIKLLMNNYECKKCNLNLISNV